MNRTLQASTMAFSILVALVFVSCSDAAPSASSDSPEGLSPTDLGAQVYADSCASCHGVDLRGTDKGPSQLSIVYEPGHHTDDSYRSAITDGAPQHHWAFGDMPQVEGLSDDEVEAVIDYIRSEQQSRGFEQ